MMNDKVSRGSCARTPVRSIHSFPPNRFLFIDGLQHCFRTKEKQKIIQDPQFLFEHWMMNAGCKEEEK